MVSTMTSTSTVKSEQIAPPLRLAEFRVNKLFGEFDYKIPLNLDSRVTAIIAPNGTGKTLCLRMINGFFDSRWSIFAETEFDTVKYKFTNGLSVSIKKDPAEKESDEIISESNFEIIISSNESYNVTAWRPRLYDSKRSASPERYLPFLSRIPGNKWRNDHTGQIYSLSEIIERFDASLPKEFKDNAYGKKPEALTAIIDNIDCKLIETQRLLVFQGNSPEHYYYGQPRPRTNLAIAEKAETLKEIISREINAYAALSQSLDRSFPRRVIQQQHRLPAEDLRKQLQDLDIKRRKLMAVGILDPEADDSVALPEGEFEGTISRVLSVYADDTSKKLASLSNILEKITLFKKLIDRRFLTKDVTISKSHGIDVYSHGHSVALEKLSSGEQHQLVLFFELLFEIRHNSLILIDEPELSLHVAWQKKFISDLMSIIDLNKFDVVLATHSPQLIGRWNNLVVELGDVDGDVDEAPAEVIQG
ncbi:MAG: excinuclease ATPase subunit [Methylobacterium brachiatum]|jgi:predicted ATPase|nr:excinuclease ATPase subunit [Methylobacterium brachiatum]